MLPPSLEPSAQHRALALLEGRFRGAEQRTDAGEPIGTYHVRFGLGGFALLLDYEQAIDGARRYAMHGVIGWEPAEERYYFHWYDSLGGLGTSMRGQLVDRVLTLEGPDPVRGGRARFTFDASDGADDGFVLTMSFSEDGETWIDAMSTVYRQVH